MNWKVGLSVLAGAVLIIATAACNFSPTGPFDGFDEEQKQGATLEGQFQQGGGTSSLRQSATSGFNGLTTFATAADELLVTQVIVYDTDYQEIARVDIESDGSFTLRGLPDAFYLVFVDENETRMGEAMYFDGIKPNQEIDIIVAMANGDVVLVEERRTGIDDEGATGVELEGLAENVEIDSPPDMMTGSLSVDVYNVLTRAGETSIRKGNRSFTLEYLKENEGTKVKVRGVFEDGDVFAYEIKIQDELEEDDTTTPTETCDYEDPNKPGKILVCHKGKTLSISSDAWPAHWGHGDKCGRC